MGKKTRLSPGMQFNQWTLMEYKVDENNKKLGWQCHCSCGNSKLIYNISTVINGASTSCGCYRKEFLKINNPMHNIDIATKVGRSSSLTKMSMTKEERSLQTKSMQTVAAKAKRIATNNNRYGGNSPICSNAIRSKTTATILRKYGVTSPAKLPAVVKKMSDTYKDRTGFDNPAQNPEVIQKIKNTNLDKYGVESVLGSKQFRSEALKKVASQYNLDKEICNVSQIPEIRKKMFANKGMSQPEKTMNEFLKNNHFHFDYEAQCGDSGKLWDFVIYKNNNPVMVIEIDGEYVHALNADPNGSKSGGHYDHLRFNKLPDGVNYLQIDSKRVKDSFAEILRLNNVSYEDFIKEMIDSCMKSPFPYPLYDEHRMIKDYKNLCIFDRETTHNVKLGNSIVSNFHKSIFTSSKDGKPSPVKAWSTPDLLERCIRNRAIYHGIRGLSSQDVTKGFSVGGIAPKVSVFQPSLARWILKTYTPKSKTVLDPFSGFSGRMLGATSLGLSYTGSDIRSDVIVESFNIVNFLKLKGVTLNVSSIEDLHIEEKYDVLLTCPPYGNKEIWFDGQQAREEDYYIDMCLQKFQCKTYIFVVKDTVKYSQYIMKAISNKSHLSESEEQLIVIDEEAAKFIKNKETI